MKSYQLPPFLTVNSISEINRQMKKLSSDTAEVLLDLSAVKTVDSAGIAFLVNLKSTYHKVNFINPTAQINNLCQLYKIQL